MIFLLYGEDEYLKEEYLRKIKKNFGELQLGINYIQIDENNIQNIISDIETPSFGFEKKLIIVKNCDLFKKKSILADNISEYIENNVLSNIELVFIQNDIEKNNLFNCISKTGTIKQFDEQKMPQLIQKVKSICSAYEINIKENTAQYFIEVCGCNMQDIINEIRKLIEFVGKGGEIKKENIDLLTIKKTESIIFDLTDNLGKKNIKKAIEVLHNLVYSKEPIQRILVMLYGHFKKLYIVSLSNGQNITANLKLKPSQSFLVNKYIAQAKTFSEIEIRNLLEAFIKLDEDSKNGNIDLNVGLEAVLCNYCHN